ncbi:MAG TPA: glycine--tRNA ligase subunit beta, partial [Sorangium sp.]|nr:glycine--tRNA ligase subunit beta [Sorangium sp.]
MTTHDLLFEIGCEELPASFVDGALKALVPLAEKSFAQLRLSHGQVRALGTPRRLALLVTELSSQQPDLDEEVMGPPLKIAFKDGTPTRAAEAFANKVGCALDALEQVDTPRGRYLKGIRHQQGRATAQLLPQLLAQLVTAIPFRKSMRWGAGELAFGRPLRWLFARYGSDALEVTLPAVATVQCSYGHRFLHPGEVMVPAVGDYVAALRKAHVLVDPVERARVMQQRLQQAAA